MVAAADAARAGVVPNPANGEVVRAAAAGADVAVGAAPNPPKGFPGADVAGADPSL